MLRPPHFYNIFTESYIYIYIKEVLRPSHFYNIFTTNYKWLIIIGSNLNLTLLFCPNNNNVSLWIFYKNIMKILYTYYFFIDR